jgi:CDP-diacylglycerol---glycerol-3-phosphate 3-phosphatidyltransferase
MPSVYDLKPAFQRLLRPLVVALAGAGVTANQVTVAAVVLSAAGGAAIAAAPQARWPLLLLPAILLLRMAANAVDGMLAREHGMQSSARRRAQRARRRAVRRRRSTCRSRWSPASIAPLLVVAVVVLALIAEMTGVVGVQIGASRRYDGPMGKSDRALVFALVALALGLGAPGGAWLASAARIAVALLSVLTIVNRARRARGRGADELADVPHADAERHGGAGGAVRAAGAREPRHLRARPPAPGRDLPRAVAAGALVVDHGGIFAFAISLSRTASLVFFAFVSFLAFKEYLSLIPTRRADRGVIFWAYLAIPVQYWVGRSNGTACSSSSSRCTCFLFLPMRMALIGETTGFLRAAGTLHWGLMMTVFNLSHVAYLLVLPLAKPPAAGLAVAVAGALPGVADPAQRRRPVPLGQASRPPQGDPEGQPRSKTWEGLVGGVATTTRARLAGWHPG